MNGQILILNTDNATSDKLKSVLSILGYKQVISKQRTADPVEGDFQYIFASVPTSSKVQDVIGGIQAQYPHVPVILLLEHINKESVEAAMSAGAGDVIAIRAVDETSVYKAILAANRASGGAGTGKQACVNYRTVFMESPHPMWIYDTATLSFLQVNNAAIDRYGYTEDEFLNMSIKDIRPEDEIPKLLTARGKETGSTFVDCGFWNHRRRNGETFYAHIHSQPTTFQGKEAKIIVAMDVDEKVRAERANSQLNSLIEQQNERIDHILSSVKEIIWSCDAETFQMLYINEACRDIYGYSPEEVMADKELYFSLVHPDDREQFVGVTEQIFSTGSYVHEYRIRHRNGSIKHVRGEAFLKKGADGRKDVISGLTIDITDLRKTESALQEKVDETDNILDSITDGFFILDKEWRFKYVNKAFERICSVKREEIIGQNYWERFPKSVSLKWYTEYHRAMRDQVSVHFEEYASSLDRWVSVSAYPKPGSLTVYFTDVTEEHKLLEKIAYDERNLFALINNTQDLIWSVDKNLNIISANDAYKQSIYTLVGKTVSSGETVLIAEFGEEHMRKWKGNYLKALAGKAYKIVEQVRHRGEEKFVETNFNPIRNSEEVIGVSCFSRDITEERKLQERIASNERNLRALIDNTNDFVWSVDRELNIITINKTFQDALTFVTGRCYDTGDSIVMDEFGPEMKEKWDEYYRKALEGEKFTVTDEQDLNGVPNVRETCLNPIINEEGEIVGVSCYARDITEQRRMQEEIQMNEHNMRGLINSTKDLIWSVDPTWHIISANDAFTIWMKKMNGITLHEGDYALPSTFGEKIVKKFTSYYERALNGESFRVTERLKPNKYDIEYIETRYHPIFNDKGVVIGVSCSTRDITETRRYQERIEAKNQKLRDIASIQSHEVRGQVASILGLGQLFNYDDPADPINASVLEGFMEATQNLDRIIRRIVSKTRIMDEM